MANFYETVLTVLKADERFIAEDGTFLRNAVYEAAMKMDEGLIRFLLSNEETCTRFFTDVDGVKVFDKMGFSWVINNRQFLPDCYTRFKNKIGLADENGDLIATSGKVELVFPYKDCVLEGGQTKEDQRRQEIFYNEMLAPDEVDRLLYPKVLVGAKRYSYDGDYDSTGQPTGDGSVKCEVATDFSDTDNLIIKGNNLLAMYSLLPAFEGQIKSIVVDPPYFFAHMKADDAFKYNSNFRLSTWLCFCKDRFIAAKRLLSNDGFLTVTMGVDGYSYLKNLLDEIFDVANNPSNYLGTITWRKTDNQSNIGEFSNVIDYILIYRKSADAHLGRLALSDKAIKEYSYEDKKGKYRRANLLDQTRGRFYYDVLTPDGSILNGPWMISAEDFELLKVAGGIHWPKQGLQIPYGKTYLNDSLENGQITSDFWDGSYGTNQRGADEIKALFGERAFSFAKPEKLLYNLISLTSKSGDIVLDFCLGSGTTCAVAAKMKRKYIGIDQMDYIEELAVQRLRKVICGEQGGISKEVNWQGGGSFVYCELAKLNQSFVDEIESAGSADQIKDIYKRIIETGFISSKVNPKDIDAVADDFDALSLDNKKRFLMELLDKNLLYVNLCDLDDEEFAISEEDKAFTKSFYKEG